MADYRSNIKEEAAAKALEIIQNFDQEGLDKTESPVKQNAKNQKLIKKKKKELRKKVVTRIAIVIGVLIMTVGGAFVKKIVTGKEALRRAGADALPRNEYSISEGSNGYNVMNIKTNQPASYGDYIGAIKENAIENNIEPISVYLAVEDVTNGIVAKDAAGRDFSTLEIVDAALEYVDALNENKGKGSR